MTADKPTGVDVLAEVREWATCNQQRIENGRMGSSEAYDNVLNICNEYESILNKISLWERDAEWFGTGFLRIDRDKTGALKITNIDPKLVVIKGI